MGGLPCRQEFAGMRRFVFVFSAIVMLACLTAANATDLNGKWKGDLKTPNGDMRSTSTSR
jgi:hypothetical protein